METILSDANMLIPLDDSGREDLREEDADGNGGGAGGEGGSAAAGGGERHGRRGGRGAEVI